MPNPPRITSLENAKFILDQLEKRLVAYHDADDSVIAKAFTLLSITIPIATSLVAYCLIQFNLGSALFYAAALYALPLIFCSILLWKVVDVTAAYYPGYDPETILKPNLVSAPEIDLYNASIEVYQTYIEDNDSGRKDRARKLKKAMRLFVLSPIPSIVLLGIAALLKLFAWLYVNGLLCPVTLLCPLCSR